MSGELKEIRLLAKSVEHAVDFALINLEEGDFNTALSWLASAHYTLNKSQVLAKKLRQRKAEGG